MRGNTVSLQGKVTRDAEVATTAGGSNIVSFGLAWNQSKKTQNGVFEDVPHFFEVKFWATEAQLRVVLDQIVKGAGCSITAGHITQERWQDKQGNSKSRVVVMVEDPIKGMLVRPKGATSQGAGAGGYGAQSAYAAHRQGYGHASGGYADDPNQPPLSVYDSDIPF